MKILILPSWHISRMEPDFFTIADKQAAALAEAGNDVVVVYTAPYSWKRVFQYKRIPFAREEKTTGRYRQIIVYRPKTHIWRLDLIRRNLWGKREIRRLFRNGDLPDIVHVHTFFAGKLGRWVREKYGIPYVVTEHFTGFARKIVPSSQMRLARKIFNDSDLNIAVSPPFKSLLEKETGARFVSVPNMVDTDHFFPSGEKPSEPYTFIFVGMLHPKKRPLLILEAFRLLRENGLACRLKLVGEGQLRKELETRIQRYGLEDYVDLPGYCLPEELPSLLRKCRCFVFPSAFETFGVAPVEALSCGLPIIVTASGGPETYIREDENGYLVEPTVEALAEAMKKAMNRKWDPDAIRSYVVRHFSNSAVADTLMRYYRELT